MGTVSLTTVVAVAMQAAALVVVHAAIRGQWMRHPGALFILVAVLYHGGTEVMQAVWPGRNPFRAWTAQDMLDAWYGKDGPQNYGKWSNNAFQDLVSQIDRELDTTKRKTLVSQADALMEQDPPLLPVSWEKINDAWYDYVKGHNPYDYFGMFDVVRFDTFWLDR